MQTAVPEFHHQGHSAPHAEAPISTTQDLRQRRVPALPPAAENLSQADWRPLLISARFASALSHDRNHKVVEQAAALTLPPAQPFPASFPVRPQGPLLVHVGFRLAHRDRLHLLSGLCLPMFQDPRPCVVRFLPAEH